MKFLGHMNSIGQNSSIQHFRSVYYFLDIQYIYYDIIFIKEQADNFWCAELVFFVQIKYAMKGIWIRIHKN